ncbi:MAG: hypothetical protein K6E29_05325 [Cyanobacteria bacterium RUI128]|nr:hypothetical protein [Cyanobacteria bacterium RUI128]
MQVTLYPNRNQYVPSTPKKQKTPVSFGSNPYSRALAFTNNDFFINIQGYGRNEGWATAVRSIADNAAIRIRQVNTSDEVLAYIATGIKGANCLTQNLCKKTHSGILRTNRKGYGRAGQWKGTELVTPLKDQYVSYIPRLEPLKKTPLKSPFYDIDVAKIETSGPLDDYEYQIVHPTDEKINNALDRVGGKFFNLKKDFISKPQNVTNDTLPQINSDIAEIRWIMAQSMPWERGSDAISNVFMRSLYKSMGVKTYPVKKGISLDLEAFCTPLSEYKKNFSTYFEVEPRVTY